MLTRESFRKQTKGFTLIELLVVIAIIGLLASIVIVSVQKSAQNARDAKRKADIRSLKTAIEQYTNNNQGRYPVCSTCVDWKGHPVSDLVTMSETTAPKFTDFLNPIPSDPAPTLSGNYQYVVRSDASGYGLRVKLESNTTYCLTGGGNINYGWWGVPLCDF
jgi:type II secretion system protein G